MSAVTPKDFSREVSLCIPLHQIKNSPVLLHNLDYCPIREPGVISIINSRRLRDLKLTGPHRHGKSNSYFLSLINKSPAIFRRAAY